MTDAWIPHDINDIASMGLDHIEVYGVNSRLYFFTLRPRPDDPVPPRREIVLSVWMPTDALVQMGVLVHDAIGTPTRPDGLSVKVIARN